MPERDPNRLPTTVVPSHYDLHLAPDLDAASFTGTAAIDIEVTEPVDEIVLHALDLDHLDLDADTPLGQIGFNLTFHTIAKATMRPIFQV